VFREVIKFLYLIPRGWTTRKWINSAEVGGLFPVKNIPSRVVIWLNLFPLNRRRREIQKKVSVGEDAVEGVEEHGDMGAVAGGIVRDIGGMEVVAMAVVLTGGTAGGTIGPTMPPP